MSAPAMDYGFHTHDGWHFKRVDGWVHMTRVEDGEAAEFVVFSPETWASVVAFVSAYGGGDGEAFRAAENFHRGRSSAVARIPETP